MTGHTWIAPLAGCTLALGLAVYLYWRNRKSSKETIPDKWQEIGRLTDLMCYPIKSLAPVRQTEFNCTILGLQKGVLRDRVFMVTDEQGKNITGRQHPILTQIFPRVDGDTVTLKYKDKTSSFSVQEIMKKDCQKATVWGQAVEVVDCGDEVAQWLSQLVLNSQSGLRIVYYYKPHPTRPNRANKKAFKKIQDQDSGALPDFTSYMLMSKSSVDDLNTRLEKPVTAYYFRPNFLIEGPKPYEEDKWEWVKIGDSIFRAVKPCNRCIFTTIDPETGIKDPDMEPLKTLRIYRNEKDPNLRKYVGDSPVLGVHLTLRDGSSVKLNDKVYVNYG